MKYPVSSSLRHKGKALDLDATREVITLLGINGETMGNLSWDFVIDQILAYRNPPTSRETRNEPRVALTFRIKYKTPEGQQFESAPAESAAAGSLSKARALSRSVPSSRLNFRYQKSRQNGCPRRVSSPGSVLRQINIHLVQAWGFALRRSTPRSAISCWTW